jgi:hypothetical protein
LKTLSGLNSDSFQIDVEGTDHCEFVETSEMNPVELACAKGFHDILRFFVYELNLKSKSEFNENHQCLPIE